ncbi:hypothetical protein [Leptospira tipperaryensis]|uniref:hypothetical protein n=1 Tax=Leptospira tipperaryensis TaxID=2564040 RepID=UPI0012EAB083|nr:hypothetical protein [Leptospira tipperaryensis]
MNLILGSPSSANHTITQTAPQSESYSVSITVSGLSGSGLILQNNGSDSLSIVSNGSFSFSNSLNSGSSYNVTVFQNPSTPSQICSVSNGAGLIASSSISNISVVCSTNSYSISGNVTGLAGGSLVLKNNGTDDLAISANGSFSFPTPIASGSTYSVTVAQNPNSPSQVCSVGNASGSVSGSNITNIAIACVDSYSIGGSVTVEGGVLNGNIVVTNSTNGDSKTVLTTSSFPYNFTMSSSLSSGSAYNLNVSSPSGQTCRISLFKGAVVSSNINNIRIHCLNGNKGAIVGGLSIQGNMSGLTGNMEVAAPFTNTIFAGVVSGNLGIAGAAVDGSVGNSAYFDEPYGMATDGNSLYVADYHNHLVRKIDIATRTTRNLFSVENVQGIATDGVFVYASGKETNTIVKYDLGTSTLTVIAPMVWTGSSYRSGYADGPAGTTARFNCPIALTTDGVNLYIADSANHVIRKIDLNTNIVSTVAGIAGSPLSGPSDNAIGTLAQFNNPSALILDADGTSLYVSDTSANKIRLIDLSISGNPVTTIAGFTTGAAGASSLPRSGLSTKFHEPLGIVSDGSNYLFVSDAYNNRIVRIAKAFPNTVTFLSGSGSYSVTSGVATAAGFYTPWGIAFDGQNLFMTNMGNVVRRME